MIFNHHLVMMKVNQSYTRPIILIQSLLSDPFDYEPNVGMNDKEQHSFQQHDFLVFTDASKDKPLRDLLGHDLKRSILVAILTSLLIGSFFKYILYSYTFQTGKQNHSWMHRPISVLILTQAIIHHSCHIIGWMMFSVCMLSEKSIAYYLGLNSCYALQVVGLFGNGYMTIGGLGIAVYRVLYIKHENWVKYVIGEKLLLFIVWFLSITICLVLAILYNLEMHSHRFSVNMCLGISETHAKILIDYALSRGQKLLTTTYIQTTLVSIGILMQLAELSIFVWFFRLRYKNDNGNIKKVLTEDVIKARNIKNVGTFLGQFYGFLMEFAFAIAILTILRFGGENTMELKAFSNIIKFMDFGLISGVEVLTSPVLRDHMRTKF